MDGIQGTAGGSRGLVGRGLGRNIGTGADMIKHRLRGSVLGRVSHLVQGRGETTDEQAGRSPFAYLPSCRIHRHCAQLLHKSEVWSQPSWAVSLCKTLLQPSSIWPTGSLSSYPSTYIQREAAYAFINRNYTLGAIGCSVKPSVMPWSWKPAAGPPGYEATENNIHICHEFYKLEVNWQH
jgi:hypothetical protein